MNEGSSSRAELRASWEAEYAGPHPVWRGPGELEPGLPEAGLVLELGCGNGKTLSALAARERTIVGLDFSRNAVAACRRFQNEMPDLMLVQADMADLPFNDDCFDLVLCYHVLDHARAQLRRSAAHEIVRVTKPEGTISFRGFSTIDLRFGKGVEVEPRTFSRGKGLIYHYFEEDEVKGLFIGTELRAFERRSRPKRFHGERVERAEIAAAFVKRRGEA